MQNFVDKDGWLVCTYFNGGYTEYVKNFVKCLERFDKKWTLCCICIDEVASLFCEENNIPYIKFIIENEINSFCKWGDSDYKKIVFKKLDTMKFVLEHPCVKYCVYIDTDIFVYKDFLPYLKENISQLDALFQCDEDKGNEIHCLSDVSSWECQLKCLNVCTGLMVLKNCDAVKSMLEYSFRARKKIVDYSSDQEYVNEQKGLILFRTLPRSLFPNGSFIHQNRIPYHSFLLHYNYLVGHLKKEYMKRHHHWLI